MISSSSLRCCWSSSLICRSSSLCFRSMASFIALLLSICSTRDWEARITCSLYEWAMLLLSLGGNSLGSLLPAGSRRGAPELSSWFDGCFWPLRWPYIALWAWRRFLMYCIWIGSSVIWSTILFEWGPSTCNGDCILWSRPESLPKRMFLWAAETICCRIASFLWKFICSVPLLK